MKVAIDRGPGPLSIAGLKKKYPLQEVGFAIRGVVVYDPAMAMLTMAILVHVWTACILGHCATCTHPKAQPAALYCSLVTWAMLG